MSERAVHRPPGIIAPDEPRQVDLEPPETFSAKGYTFAKRARFDMTARLLRKERYRVDAEAGLAPFDLGVGWGPLSDSAVPTSSSSRWGAGSTGTRSAATSPSARGDDHHLAQMHMIPATREIEARLDRLRPGQLVSVRGFRSTFAV